MAKYFTRAVSFIHEAIYNLAKTSTSPPPTGKSQLIRVVCIADTHSQTLPIPPGDLLIHAGDLSRTGSKAEIQATVTWLASQPHTHKVVISGNADRFFDATARLPEDADGARNMRAADAIDWRGVVHLQREAATLEFERGGAAPSRALRVYGDPHVPRCGETGVEAFQYEAGEDFWRDAVPRATDVLVTHTPPKFLLDEWDGSAEGCVSLWNELRRVKPALHVFGHVHPGCGERRVCWDAGALDRYELLALGEAMSAPGQSPFWVLPKLAVPAFKLLARSLWRVSLSWVHAQGLQCSTVVNAACASPDGTYMKNRPRILEI